MVNISQRCQYALRALFELARNYGQSPVAIADIADAQAIPPRFLELILGQLKQTGWMESYRGIHGGYLLAVEPQTLTLGEVIRFIEGPLAPVRCIAGHDGRQCPLQGQCAFAPMWEKAERAVAGVYDSTTFADLVEQDSRRRQEQAINYCI